MAPYNGYRFRPGCGPRNGVAIGIRPTKEKGHTAKQ